MNDREEFNTDDPPSVTVEEFEGFTILWTAFSHYVRFEVTLEDEAQDEPYAKGYVKWDGCTEITESRHHWCGGYAIGLHLLLIQHLYDQAFELMNRQNDDELIATVTKV